MLRIARSLVLVGLVSALGACPLGAQTAAPVPGTCWAIDDVGTESGNPFTAERITRSTNRLADGTEKTMETDEFVARDSTGRLRFERHLKLPDDEKEVTLMTRGGGSTTITNEALKKVIMVIDCYSGKTIMLQPGIQIARVTQTGASPIPRQKQRPYASLSSSLLGRKASPDLSVLDLGSEEVEGILARGVKVTSLGSDKDGEWNGKTISVHETWASEDLAATLLDVRTDMQKGATSERRLTNIKRHEPENTLFEIPPGYKINPTPAEMPYQELH